MSQNSKLLNLTTKATIKQCKYNSKTVTNLTFLIIHAPVHDGKNGIITKIDIYLKNPCKHKQFQVKYTYKFKA